MLPTICRPGCCCILLSIVDVDSLSTISSITAKKKKTNKKALRKYQILVTLVERNRPISRLKCSNEIKTPSAISSTTCL